MEKKDREFMMKVAKQAGDAMKIAQEAKAAVIAIMPKAELPVADIISAGATEPTQTYVQFANPQEMQKHAPSIMQLNKDIDSLCKAIGVKELRVTYKAL